MEAAAKKVQLLAQRILPDRPHHLSVSTNQRYRVPPDHSKIFEEFKHQRLQYMTLLSDADRGMLITRPYYDMREEPPIPVAMKEQNAKMEKKVTKLSLSDYKNKQKKTTDSPPDSGVTPKPTTLRRDTTDIRSDREPKKLDGHRSREAEALKDTRAHKPRDVLKDERSSRAEAKPRATQETYDVLEKRKRALDVEGELRPQKRPKPEARTPLDERSRTPRDDTPKRKELHASQDRTPQKESKSGTTLSLTNGRSALKAMHGSNANKSPTSRVRGDLINGNKLSPSSSSRSKADASSSSRTTVPPLLSPLHLPNEGDSRARDKKRREDVGEPGKPQKSVKPEPPPPLKRPRSPIKLPSLLSPTLPPMLEEELARMKKTPTKGSTPSQKTQPPESPTESKRSHAVSKEEEDEDRRDLKDKIKEKPRRLLVTLKYSRKNAKTVQRLLALAPRKEVIKKERSTSIEPSALPQARKRPISSADGIGEAMAVKRPRTSDITGSSKLVTPSTPSKAATSMSRVASSNSVNTPGDGSSLTPAAPPSADRDRPQTKGDARDSIYPAKIQALRDRHGRFSKLGTKLKHERDMILERKIGDRATHISDSDSKLSMILGLETALAFMVGFRALVESRHMENKAQDPKQWASILPLLNVMRSDMRKSRPLEALFWQLQGVIHEELTKCFWSIDPASNAVTMIGWEKQRATVWKSAADSADRVEDSAMRTNMGPWTTVEEAVSSALRIMRRWAHEENVSWRAEVTVPAANGTSS